MVAPGADPSVIALQADGGFAQATATELVSGDGLRIHAPRVLQAGSPVPGAFEVAPDGSARIALGPYDAAQPLVIDPKVGFSSFLGGVAGAAPALGNDQFTAAKGYGGFLYLAGTQTSAGTFCTPAPNCNAPVGTRNPNTIGTTVVKLDPTTTGPASLVWVAVLSATAVTVNDIDVDAAGVYITGTATPAVAYYTTPNAFQTTPRSAADCSTGFDSILTMMSLDGASVPYSTYFGGAWMDYGYGVSGGNGQPVIVGTTLWSSRENMPAVGGFQLQHNGPVGTSPTGCGQSFYDGFVARFDPTAAAGVGSNGNPQSLLFSSYVGGAGNDIARSVMVDRAGNIWVAGGTSSTLATQQAPTGFPGKNAYSDNRGLFDAFVVEVAGDGASVLYGTEYGGAGDDFAEAVTAWNVAGVQRVAIAGQTKSAPPSLPFNPGTASFDNALSGVSAGFLTLFDPTQTATPGNQLVQTTLLETGVSTDNSHIFALQPDPAPTATVAPTSIYVEGSTDGGFRFPRQHAWPALDGGGGPPATPTDDLFVAQFGIPAATPLKDLLFSTAVGGPGDDVPSVVLPVVTTQAVLGHPGTLLMDGSGTTGAVVVGTVPSATPSWPVTQSASNPGVSLASGSPAAYPKTYHSTFAGGSFDSAVVRFVGPSEPYVACGGPTSAAMRGASAAFTWAPAGLPHTQGIETYDTLAASDPNYGMDMNSFKWTFGDGTTLGPGNYPTPSHTYATTVAPGPVTVTLEAKDTAGRLGSATCTVNLSDTLPIAVCVAPAPPYFANNGIPLASTGSMDRDGSIASYAWSASPDGTFSDATVAAPTVTFPTSGSKTVTLVVTDNNGAPSGPLRSVASGGGLWVAVGDGGAIYTSPDGSTWTPQASGTTNTLRGVDRSSSLWVAVGDAGTILTSPDGMAWTPRTSPAAGNLNAVSGQGSKWVAAGAAGAILTSPDGVTWTARTSGTTNDLRTVASGSTFWTVAGDGMFIATSTDAVTWTSRSLHRVAFASGQWVAVGDAGLVLTSPDGAAWTGRTSGTTNALRGVAFGGGKWVAVGDAGTVLTSSDAITWASNPQGATNYQAVAYSQAANVNWVAVGNGGAVRTATDPTASWASQSAGSSQLYGVAYGSDGSGTDKWVTVGVSSSVYTRAATASTWSLGTLSTAADLNDVANGGGKWVAVGPSGAIRTWAGTGNWATATGASGTLQGVAYSPARWVAVGAGGLAFASPDSVTPWSNAGITMPTTDSLEKVAFSGTRWATVGNGGIRYGSPDGLAWSGTSLRGAAFDGTQWLLVGTSGTILAGSPTGILASRASGTGMNLAGVAASGTRWMVVGQAGTVLSSPDTTAWTAATTPAVDLHAVAFGSATWVAVGNPGTVLRSTDGTAWMPRTATCLLDVQPGAAAVDCTGPATAVVGQTASFTATGGTGAYAWSATGPASPASHTGSPYGVSWSAAGTYTVTVTAGTTDTCSITVNPPLACAGPSSLIVGATGTFTASNAGPSYDWAATGPATPASFTGNPFAASWSSPGAYDVTVTSGTETATCSVTVAATLSCSGPSSLLIGATGTFTAASGAAPYGWTATGPATPASFTGNPFGVSWSAAGSYTVTVTAGSETASCPVTVSATPLPLACSGPTLLLAGASGTFTANGGTAPYAWAASAPGSPASGSGATFSTSWSSAGTRTVTLTTATETATCTVTVEGVLACSGPASVAIGAAAAFTATGGSAPYSWTASGPASPATGSTASFSPSWSAAGTYTVQVATATQGASCSITVASPPSCSGAGSVARNVATTFTVSGASPPYSWTASGPAAPATFTGNPYTLQWSAAGTYSVTVTSGAQSATCTIVVTGPPPANNRPPVAAFTAVPGTVAVGEQATFMDSSSDPDGDAITGWRWAFGDGATSTARNPTHTYAAAGTYTVCLSASDVWNLQGSPRCFTVKVNPASTPIQASAVGGGPGDADQEEGLPGDGPGDEPREDGITVEAGATQHVQPGETVVFAASAPGHPGASYSWHQAAGPSIDLMGALTAAASFQAPAGPAVLYFEVTAQDGSGSDVDGLVVFVDGPASTVEARTQDAQGKTGATVALDASASTGAGPLSFRWSQWSGPAVALQGASQAHGAFVPQVPGTYVFAVEVSDGTGSAVAVSHVTVTAAQDPDGRSAPAASFTVEDLGGGRVRLTPAVAADSYAWRFGDERATSDGAIVHTFPATGTYDVEMAADGGEPAVDQVHVVVAGEPATVEPAGMDATTVGLLALGAIVLVGLVLAVALRRTRA